MHTVSLLVENKPGALARVSNLFARRGYNIESLAVGPTERPDVSRITLRVDCSHESLEQLEKQMHKLVNVLRVSTLEAGEAVVAGRIRRRDAFLLRGAAAGDSWPAERDLHLKRFQRPGRVAIQDRAADGQSPGRVAGRPIGRGGRSRRPTRGRSAADRRAGRTRSGRVRDQRASGIQGLEAESECRRQ